MVDDGPVSSFHDARTLLSMIPNASSPDNDRFQIANPNIRTQRSEMDNTPKVKFLFYLRVYNTDNSSEVKP